MLTCFRYENTLKSGTLLVDVLGYRQLFQTAVEAQNGVKGYFIAILPKGAWCEVSQKRIILQKPGIIIYKPGDPIYHGKDEGLIRSWVRGNAQNMEQLLALYELECGKLYTVENIIDHENIIVEMYKEFTHPLGCIAGNVDNLFTNWLRMIRREENTTRKIPLGITKARTFIEENYLTGIELKDLVKVAGMSRATVCRGFNKYYHISPQQYVIQLRISLAKELLQNKNLTLEEVANQCGFADQYYFSRCFKNQAGVTPGTFRG